MRILGIETSCDETAIAIIDVAGSPASPCVRVLSNIVASQVKLHAKFGGVVPNLAKREHQKNLVPTLLQAFSEADFRNSKLKIKNAKLQFKVQNYVKKLLEREQELLKHLEKHILPFSKPRIDAIAVTVGPGLAPALWVGVNFARTLAFLWGKPLIPVNHLEGHILTNLLQQIRGSPKSEILNPKQIPNPKFQFPNRFEFRISNFEFPAIALLVSGGHTELVLMSGYGKYRVVGETLDDAAGEAFDKVAKMLRLGFPGGPEIAAQAAKIKNAKLKMQNDNAKFKIKLPRPMIASKDYNFSFSGLKTAALYLIRNLMEKYPMRQIRPPIAAEFEQAVVDVLVAKTIRAAREFGVKTVMIGGGVAANKKLRADLGEVLAKHLPGIRYLVPDSRLTGDNALMIALAGWFNRKKNQTLRSIHAEANLRIDARRTPG